MRYPDTEQYECLPVFSPEGASGQIIDDQVVAEQEAIKEATKKGFFRLAECYSEKDWQTVLNMLMDGKEPQRVRGKAAEMIGDIGEIDAIEPLRSHKFGNQVLQKQADSAVVRIHERSFTRECPFCAEIIKKRAKICKHCGRDVAGQ